MEYTYRAGEYLCIPFGYRSGVHSNRSCGITFMLRARRFREHHIKKVFNIPTPLWGRCAALRIVQGEMRLVLIGLYFPPRHTRREDRIRDEKTVTTMVAWLSEVLHKLTSHDTVLIFADLNDGLRYDDESTCCGMYSAGDEHYTTKMVRPLLDGMQITSYGTHFRMAPSYIGEHH
eukprot:9479210-Pyramimonas_sp.AAC.1